MATPILEDAPLVSVELGPFSSSWKNGFRFWTACFEAIVGKFGSLW